MNDDIKIILHCDVNEKNQIIIYDIEFDDFNYIEEDKYCNYKDNSELITEALMAMFIYDFSPKMLREFISQKHFEIVYEDKVIKVENENLNENSKICKLVNVLESEIYFFVKELAEKYEQFEDDEFEYEEYEEDEEVC